MIRGENWFIADSRILRWSGESAAFGIAVGSGGDNSELGEVEVSDLSFGSTPPVAQRNISQQSFNSGDTLQVNISVFVSGDDCNTTTVRETVPQGWTVSNITCSLDAFDRNFTLGQGRFNAGSDRFEMRYRTTENNEFQVDSPRGSLTEALTHVVWTRAENGTVAVYINNESLEVLLSGGEPITEVPGEFSQWDDSYFFGIGNEIAANRAWLGQFHIVAIYNRALSADEVNQNFRAGPFEEFDTSVNHWAVY